MNLDWHNVEDIAFRLLEEHPGVDPLTVWFTDLHLWVCDLKEFIGRPEGANEGILERIQMAWYEEYSDL